MDSILLDAVTVYKTFLPKNPKAKAFLDLRGINEKTIEMFDLGATLPRSAFSTTMRDVFGYSTQELVAARLLSPNTRYEAFRDSVIIPIYDRYNRTISIISRKYIKHDIRYINLPHTEIGALFGEHLIAHRFQYTPHKKYGNVLVLCEGPFDTMMVHQHGLLALGIMGTTKIRPEMLNVVPLFDSVILMLDNDTAGKKATFKIASSIKYLYKHTKIYTTKLPDGIKDVADFLLIHTMDDLLDTVQELKYINPRLLLKGVNQIRKQQAEQQLAKAQKTTRDDIVNAMPILAVIKSLTPNITLSKSGQIYRARCPFKDHKDEKGSFTVYPNTNSFFCYGCGRGGKTVNFIRYFFNVSTKEAKRIGMKLKLTMKG